MRYKLNGGLTAEAHPVANVFPLMNEEQIRELAEDIQNHGQRVAIALQKTPNGDTLVLDGRNRLLACELAGIPPRYEYIDPTVNPVAFIVSTNAVRRHQNESQRALSAARLVTITGSRRPAQKEIDSIESIPQSRAAKMFNVSRSSVQRALAILDDPILVAAVESGEVRVSDAAEITEASEDAKRRAVKAVATGKAGTLREALAQMTPQRAEANIASEEPEARRPADRSEPDESDSPGSDPGDRLETPEGSAPFRSASDSSTRSEPVGASTAVPAAGSDNEPAAASDRHPRPSSDSLPRSPMSGEAPGGAGPDVGKPEAPDATASRAGDDARTEIRGCLKNLERVLVRRVSEGGSRSSARVLAACSLMLKLVEAMEHSLDAAIDKDVLSFRLQEISAHLKRQTDD